MTPHHTTPSVSRRAALAGIVGGGLGLAVLPAGDRAFAQDASPEAMVSHPVVGTWVLQFEDPLAAPVAVSGAPTAASSTPGVGTPGSGRQPVRKRRSTPGCTCSRRPTTMWS